MFCKDCISTGKCEYSIYLPFLYTGENEYKLVGIDKCLLPEILKIWEAGIKTEWCCCGHAHITDNGNSLAAIAVSKGYKNKMINLGYKQHKELFLSDNYYTIFVPKTIFKYGEVDKGFNYI